MPTTRGEYEIDYEELDSGYGEHYRRGGPEVVRRCKVRWDQASLFLYDMLGWEEYESGWNLTRYLPDTLETFGDLYDQYTMWADEAKLVETLGVPDIEPEEETIRFLDKIPTNPIPAVGEEEFGWAVYDIIYRPRMYRLLIDDEITVEKERYVQKTRTYSATNFTVAGGGMKYVAWTPERIIPENLTKLLFLTEHTYVWHRVPAGEDFELPDGLRKNIESVVGKVNKFAWEGPAGTPRFADETLLCLAPHEEKYHDAHGNPLIDLHFKFLERRSTPDTGWNTTYSRVNPAGAHAPGFYKIIGRDNATLLYDRRDFDFLFVQEEQP